MCIRDRLNLPLQTAVNSFGHSTTTISAASSPSTPRKALISPSRTPPAPSTTDFYGRLRLQQRPYRPRKPHRHWFALGAPQHRHFKTNYRVLLDHRPSPALVSLLRRCHDATASGLERLTVPVEDHPQRFHRTVLGVLAPHVPSTIPALSRQSSSLHTARLHGATATDPRACNAMLQRA